LVALCEKLLERVVGLVELPAGYAEVKIGVTRSLVQNCGREQSLEDMERAASVESVSQ
jgi:hypothetical protein